jgi:putative oxidoreductase
MPTSFAPYALSVLRIVVGLIFLEHGTGKLLGFPVMPALPAMYSLPWIAGFFELGGGLLLTLGLGTRIVAFVLCGMMAVAYFTAHAPRGFFPVLNGGDAAILFCFAFLYLSFAGGGPVAVEAWWRAPDPKRA